VSLHDAIDTLVVGRLETLSQCRAPQHRPDPPVAIGRHLPDHRFDLNHQIGLRLRRPPNWLGEGRTYPDRDVRACDIEHFAHRPHWEPPFGHDSDRNKCFFEPAETSSASFRISASIVFLPSSRCSSRTWLCSDRYSEAGTTGSSD
jgi:hypothetical protein